MEANEEPTKNNTPSPTNEEKNYGIKITFGKNDKEFNIDLEPRESLNALQLTGLISSIVIYIGTRGDLLNPFLESYGAPGAEGFVGYLFMRCLIGTSPKVSAAAAFTINAIFELDQFIQPVAHTFGGSEIIRTPDPRDIVAAAVGAGIGVGFTKLKKRKSKAYYN